jgi:Ca2+-binding RTX toxin-like protein
LNISHGIIILVVLSLLLTQGNITAQKVIDNEALSSDQDEKRSNNAESGSDLNELAAKPLVHVSIEGTEINDKIRGGDGNDVMSGEDGQDTLQGQDGDDEIDGGKDEDNIDGGAGDDEIDGGDGKDTLQGQDGDDEIDGGDDDDDIKGGLGDDEIDGGDGKDLVEGGEGKDKLEGGNDADRFVCDEEDKISDYNSLENDIIIGECDYEDKGLVPSPIPATLHDQDDQDNNNNNNFKSFDSRDSNVPDGQDNIFKKFLSKLINKDLPPIFDN